MLPSSVEDGDSFRSFSVEGMVVPVEGLGRSCLSRYRARDSGIVMSLPQLLGGRRDGEMAGWSRGSLGGRTVEAASRPRGAT